LSGIFCFLNSWDAKCSSHKSPPFSD